MANNYRLQIVTQQGTRFDGRVASLSAPGVMGGFGVRPGHAPMVAELGVGRIDVRLPDFSEHCFACTGGILEVSAGGVVILADAIEGACDIDVQRAKASEQRARERLLERKQPDMDEKRATVALARALNRLKVAHRGL